MDRQWEANAIGTPPTAPISPSTGYPTDGVIGVTPPTTPGAFLWYMLVEEIRKVIADAGITPSASSLQLSQAIRQMMTQDFAVASGTNTIIATYANPPTGYTDGLKLRFRPVNTITGAATFNPNGIGAKNIYTSELVAAVAGDIVANDEVEVTYDSVPDAWVMTTGIISKPHSTTYITPSLVFSDSVNTPAAATVSGFETGGNYIPAFTSGYVTYSLSSIVPVGTKAVLLSAIALNLNDGSFDFVQVMAKPTAGGDVYPILQIGAGGWQSGPNAYFRNNVWVPIDTSTRSIGIAIRAGNTSFAAINYAVSVLAYQS